MLKGTTKFELKDINTGETQVFEKHNDFTGALQELFNPVLGHLTNNTTLTNTLPAFSSLLGGLLLFDGRIEGDPLPLYAPDSVKLVGCARYNTSLTNGSIYFGSYDANESSISAETKTAKLVYNFTQSQANGTIGSVCLTHANGGYGVYRSDFSRKVMTDRLGVSLYNAPIIKLAKNERDRSRSVYFGNAADREREHLFAVDIDNDCAYYFKLTYDTTLVILKRNAGLKHYSIFGQVSYIIGEPVTRTLTTGIPGGYYNFDTETNTLYILGSSNDVSANGTFSITSIKLDTYEVAQTVITNTSGRPVYVTRGYCYRGRVYMLGGSGTTTVNGKTANKYDVVSFSIATGELATHGMLIYASGAAAPIPMYASDGRIYWQTGYESSVANMSGLFVTDCTVAPANTNTTLCGIDTIGYHQASSTYYPVACTPVLNHPMLMYLSQENWGSSTNSSVYSQGFYFLAHYLATINNLSTPIVKAPTQTMKVTYTIQEV